MKKEKNLNGNECGSNKKFLMGKDNMDAVNGGGRYCFWGVSKNSDLSIRVGENGALQTMYIDFDNYEQRDSAFLMIQMWEKDQKKFNSIGEILSLLSSCGYKCKIFAGGINGWTIYD